MKRILALVSLLVAALAWWALRDVRHGVQPVGEPSAQDVSRSLPASTAGTALRSPLASGPGRSAEGQQLERADAATLRLLERSTGTVPDEEVTVVGTDAEGTRWTWVFSASRGEVDVPTGSWRFATTDPGVGLFDQARVLQAGEEFTLWVSSTENLRVVVVDRAGWPLPDAWIRWHSSSDLRSHPWRGSLDFLTRGEPMMIATDEEGRAELRLDRGAWGRLEAIKAGYQNRVVMLSGEYDGEPLRLVLDEISPDEEAVWTVQVLDFTSHAPVSDATFRDEFGVLDVRPVAPGVYEGPSWLTGGTLLAIESEGHCASAFTVHELAGSREVFLLAEHKLQLTAESDGEATSSGTVAVHVEVSDSADAEAERVILPHRLEMRTGEVLDVGLPQGCRADLWAIDAEGRSASAQVLAEGAGSRVRLMLHSESRQQLYVRDAVTDTPVRSKILVDYASWRFPGLRLRSEVGEFEFPLGPHLRKVSVAAKGFVSQTLYPPSQGERALDETEPLMVWLEPRVLQSIRIVDSQADPIAGVKVTFSPDSSSSRHPGPVARVGETSRNWTPSAIASSTAITDGEGFVRVSLANLARHVVKISLPKARAGDGNRGTLYRVPARSLLTGSEGRTVELMFPAPVVARVRVESTTGDPVPYFSLSCTNGVQELDVDGRGGEWSGWLLETARTLTVSAPGFEPTTVEWSPIASDIVVSLRPSLSMEVEIEGTLPPWAGESLRLRFTSSESADGSGRTGIAELFREADGRYTGTFVSSAAPGEVLAFDQVQGSTGEWRSISLGTVRFEPNGLASLVWPR